MLFSALTWNSLQTTEAASDVSVAGIVWTRDMSVIRQKNPASSCYSSR